MSNHNVRRPAAKKQFAIALGLSIIFTVASACHLVHKPVETEKLLTPLSEAGTAKLIASVNDPVKVRTEPLPGDRVVQHLHEVVIVETQRIKRCSLITYTE